MEATNSLRDHVALEVMAALIGNPVASQHICNSDPLYTGDNFSEVVATNAFEFADAFMAARSKRRKGR